MTRILLLATCLLLASACMNIEDHEGAGPGRPVLLESQVGKRCEVQFQRSLLGASAALPIPPDTSAINGADTSIGGTLKGVSNHGILLDGEHGEAIWIPREVVLLVHFGS